MGAPHPSICVHLWPKAPLMNCCHSSKDFADYRAPVLQWILSVELSGSSADGSAQRLGRWGRRFKSCLPDQEDHGSPVAELVEA